MPLSQLQYYFGSKQGLLLALLRLPIASDVAHIARVRSIAVSLLPCIQESGTMVARTDRSSFITTVHTSASAESQPVHTGWKLS